MTSFEVPTVRIQIIFKEHKIRGAQAYGLGVESGPARSSWPSDRQHGRVVKALDSKSGGLCPRRFESGCCRSIYFFPFDSGRARPCRKGHRGKFKSRFGAIRRSYYAGVSSDRTNLSPFTKDYRGLALSCDFTVFVACKGTLKTKTKHQRAVCVESYFCGVGTKMRAYTSRDSNTGPLACEASVMTN